MDDDLVQHYADAVLALIRSDVVNGVVPGDITSFPQLHDHVDANGYVDQAGVPWEGGDYDLINAVESRVDQMLRGTTPGTPHAFRHPTAP